MLSWWRLWRVRSLMKAQEIALQRIKHAEEAARGFYEVADAAASMADVPRVAHWRTMAERWGKHANEMRGRFMRYQLRVEVLLGITD